MNRKQFLLLLVLVAVVGAAGLIIHQRGNQSWQSAATTIGQKLLPHLAVNDIAQIVIQAGTNELTLAKRDQLWRVRERGDYPANFSQISELLLKLADLKVAQSEDIGPSQLGRFELLPPGPAADTGTQIAFQDQAGKRLGSLLLGKKHLKKPSGNSQFAGQDPAGWPDGRYVLAGAGAHTVAVVSDPLDNVQAQPEPWLDKTFVSMEKPRAIAVQFAAATNSWQLTRPSETNDWQLADAQAGEKLDSSKISSVTSPFSSASFDYVAPLKSGGPTNGPTLTVETFDGFTYVVRIGPKENDNYPVTFNITANLATERPTAKDEKPADQAKLDQAFKDRQAKLAARLAREKAFERWIYYLPAYSMDEILKPRSQLLEEAKKEPPPPAGK